MSEIDVREAPQPRRRFIKEYWDVICSDLLDFFLDVWRFLLDLARALLLWVGLWVFHLIEHFFPVSGIFAEFLKNIHGVGISVAMGMFIYLSLRNVWRTGNRQRS